MQNIALRTWDLTHPARLCPAGKHDGFPVSCRTPLLCFTHCQGDPVHEKRCCCWVSCCYELAFTSILLEWSQKSQWQIFQKVHEKKPPKTTADLTCCRRAPPIPAKWGSLTHHRACYDYSKHVSSKSVILWDILTESGDKVLNSTYKPHSTQQSEARVHFCSPLSTPKVLE